MAHLYEVYKYRIKYVRLQWCRQVLKIIDSKLKKKYSINDFGCNYFQLYKEIKIKKKKNKIDYYGLDKDIKAVKIGLKYFPELKKKFKICNLEKYRPDKKDVGIISAFLEHSDNPKKILENILYSSKKFVIIRTFLGKKNSCKIFFNKNKFPFKVKIREFSFKYLEKILKENNFKVTKIKDKATKNSKTYPVNLDKKFKRRMYIIFGEKLSS